MIREININKMSGELLKVLRLSLRRREEKS